MNSPGACRCEALLCYLISEMAASAFAFAVFMSPDLQAASASFTSDQALLLVGWLDAVARGA